MVFAGVPQLQKTFGEESFLLCFNIEAFMDAGMPMTELPTTLSTEEGQKVFTDHCELIKMAPGSSAFLPCGWVGKQVFLHSGEVKKTDVRHYIVQPLLDHQHVRTSSERAFNAAKQWNPDFLNSTSRSHESWNAAKTTFDQFCFDLENEPAETIAGE